MSQDLRPKLHSAVTLAATLLSLPLSDAQCDALALELTGPVRALLAEALAVQAADVPVRCAVIGPGIDEQTGVETTQYAGCLSRICVDVDHDSPAATLAADLRRHHDVVITDVPTPTYLGLTVRPRTVHAWQYWLKQFGIADDVVTLEGSDAHGVGEKDGVAVRLCGEGMAVLLSPDTHTRSGLDVDLDSPAGTVAGKARRQIDVTAIEIRDAHTVTLTVAATSMVEWQWWLTQLSAANSPVTFEGTTALVTGSKDGATVHLRGEECRQFYTADRAAARLMGLLAETSPGQS
ncbi:hypothetical protein [Streptomyces chartreusis]|uniref:hypothetical protein n=1 Tax=Streptomyces chartreusis TaxID=1969 RepID=UPI00340B295B